MGIGFVKQGGLSREWKREGVMDKQSGESEKEEVMGEWRTSGKFWEWMKAMRIVTRA